MIVKLRGCLDGVHGGQIVLDVNGVFYALQASQKTIDTLSDTGETIILFVEHLFRQESQVLCGFSTTHEREAFRVLMNVQGVGVRVALAILSVLTPSHIAQAVHDKNQTLFTQADGVGPKLAARLVVEMKDKTTAFLGSDVLLPSHTTQSVSSVHGLNDAQEALMNLGYARGDVLMAFRDLPPTENASVQDLIRLGLNKLARVA